MLITDYLEGVAARLREVAGLTVTTNPAAAITPPMAKVYDGPLGYHASFGRGHDEIDIIIDVYVSRSDAENGVSEARLYKSGHGVKSIRAALETALTVGDVIPDRSLRAVSGSVTERDYSDDVSFIVLTVQATGMIEGAA